MFLEVPIDIVINTFIGCVAVSKCVFCITPVFYVNIHVCNKQKKSLLVAHNFLINFQICGVLGNTS